MDKDQFEPNVCHLLDVLGETLMPKNLRNDLGYVCFMFALNVRCTVLVLYVI